MLAGTSAGVLAKNQTKVIKQEPLPESVVALALCGFLVRTEFRPERPATPPTQRVRSRPRTGRFSVTGIEWQLPAKGNTNSRPEAASRSRRERTLRHRPWHMREGETDDSLLL